MRKGVYKRKPIIKAGDKYGRLTAVKFAYKNKRYKQYWLFKCDCGEEKAINVSDVKRGHIKSCGCMQKEETSKRFTTHGHAKGGKLSSTYRIWRGMKTRCFNKKDPNYKNYGTKGITICDRWKDNFENFYADMGKCPKGKTIDRIDNNGNYEPSNCRWATMREQQNNRGNNHFITYDGKTQTIAQWAREKNIKIPTLFMRLFKLNWSIKKSLTKKI